MKTHFEFVLTPEQYIKVIKRNNQRLISKMPAGWLIQMAPLAMVAALTFLLIYSMDLQQGRYANAIKPIWIAALVALAAFGAYSILYYRGLNHVLRKHSYLAGIKTTLSIEEMGLRIASLQDVSITPWDGMKELVEIDDVLLMMQDSINFKVIPANAFSSTQEKKEFIAHVRERIRGAAGVEGENAYAISREKTCLSADDVESRYPVTPKNAAFKTVLISIAQAFKLAFFLRVRQEQIYVTWWQIPLFALMALALSFVWALIQVGWGGAFQWYSLPMALFHVPVMLLAAIFAAYALQRAEKALLLAQVFLMITLALDLVMMAISNLASEPSALFNARALGISQISISSMWLALACYTAAIRFTEIKLSRRAVTLGICIFMIAMPLGMSFRQLNLWDLPYDEKESEWSRANSGLANEDNFYNQPKVLERELAAVQPERKGVADIFFVGMAGYGGQDVFMKEVDAVARLFRERFDADGHTIRLVNNNKTLAGSPIASATSLQAALKRVAQVMDKEEDILFLFLTSHGSEKHHFSLDLWPLRFNQLDPERLRKLLDESGIKNRVIVVSACYSGGFINALKDANTLVISASALDKNSFGCGNENDWTYFGNAYFNEALRNTYSFTEAFNLARPAIASREKKQKYNPSNPQIALGTAMADKLALLEQRLVAGHKLTENVSATQIKPEVPDKIEQYVALVYDAQIAAQEQAACRVNMQTNGPEMILEKNPSYFGGLNKSSAQWPRLANAWNRYSESYCAKVHDAEMMRHLYSKHLRAVVSAQDLTPALKFLTSENGKRWYAAERKVVRHLSAELTKIQYEINAVQSKTYQDEQARIYNEFIAETKISGKKP